MEMLLERDAVIDNPLAPWTPLHYAAHRGDARIVTRLLKAGANPNARSANGTTPLMMGAMSGVADVARALIKAGANPKLRNVNQDRAEDLALKRGHTDFAAITRGEEPRSLTRRLIDAVRTTGSREQAQ
jgi:ankyrin repeat protein